MNDIILATSVHVCDDAIHLQGGLDQARQPENEEHEAADDDNPGKEEALRSEDQD